MHINSCVKLYGTYQELDTHLKLQKYFIRNLVVFSYLEQLVAYDKKKQLHKWRFQSPLFWVFLGKLHL